MAEKIYYSMGEVAEMFDVNQSLIRHWEAKFDCLRPHKNKRGNRMFSLEDVEKLKQIYHLVKERGMTLEGARKVMRGASGKELAQQTELLERLQRIRSALVEVRDELKAGQGEQIISSAGAELREIEEMLSDKSVEAEELPVEAVAADTVVKEVVEESAASEPSEPTSEPSEPSSKSSPEPVLEEPTSEDSSSEQPAKKRVRRRKKSEDENKELFPFYEQSLF